MQKLFDDPPYFTVDREIASQPVAFRFFNSVATVYVAGFYINTILYSSMAEWSVPESESEEEKSMEVSVQLGGLKIPPERLLHLMRVS